jgi:hypothetical protein
LSGNIGADAPDDSETLLFEKFCGFSGSKCLFDDITPPWTLIDGMGDGLDHRLGAAKVLLVTVGIGGGFDGNLVRRRWLSGIWGRDIEDFLPHPDAETHGKRKGMTGDEDH